MARSSMRCALIGLAAFAVLSAPPSALVRAESARVGQQFPTPDGGPRAPRLQPDMEARLARLEQWLKAVMRHAPGAPDTAAVPVSEWSNADMRWLWIDASVVAQLVRTPRSGAFTLPPPGTRTSQGIMYTSAQMRRIRVLACAAGGQT